MIAPLLFFSYVFSPKFFGFFRFEDVILLGLFPFFIRYLRLASNAAARSEPDPGFRAIEKFYALFLLTAALTTLLSFATGSNGRGLWSSLTLAKILEFGLAYRIAQITVLAGGDGLKLCYPAVGGTKLQSVSGLRAAAALSLIILTVYGSFEALRGYLVNGDKFYRAYNTGWFAGESNHIAGASVILAAFVPYLFPLALVSVIVSGSRIALVALAVALTRFFIVKKRYRALAWMAVCIAFLLTLTPKTYFTRWADLFLRDAIYVGPHVDRLVSWKAAIDETPILTGVGLGARPSSVYESCYVFVFAETGIAGAYFFVMMILSMIGFRREQDHPAAGVDKADDTEEIVPTIGIALAVLSLTSNALIISRIAGPVAVALGVLSQSKIAPQSGGTAQNLKQKIH